MAGTLPKAAGLTAARTVRGSHQRLLQPCRSSFFQHVTRAQFIARHTTQFPAIVVRHPWQQSRHESSAQPATPLPTSTSAQPEAGEGREGRAAQATPAQRPDVPSYEMTCTCKVCQKRSTHRITKQGYERGTVLVTCPGCQNRHLVADHLRIFSDKAITLEDILRDKGQFVKRGSLSTKGDVEFWADGKSSES